MNEATDTEMNAISSAFIITARFFLPCVVFNPAKEDFSYSAAFPPPRRYRNLGE
jgi:hypothetical protein